LAKLTKNDLITSVFKHNGEKLSKRKLKIYLSNLEDVLKTIKDERAVCVIKKRYFEGLTLEASGKRIVNLNSCPCDGISKDRARQIILFTIRRLRHPALIKLWEGRGIDKSKSL